MTNVMPEDTQAVRYMNDAMHGLIGMNNVIPGGSQTVRYMNDAMHSVI